MRYLKPLMLAAMAILAISAVGSAVAQAEVAREPAILCLENCTSALSATFSGTGSTLATLSGKTLTGTGVEGTLKGCKPLAGSEKDTTLCEAQLTFKGVKKEATNCRSESSSGVKDAVETVLALTDVHIANGENAAKELVPLALFKVLGQTGTDTNEELIILCGVVKEKVKGAISCEGSPGLVNLAAGAEAKIVCKVNATTHDQETTKCELLCEWLTEHPFEENVGAGVEDASMEISTKGGFNKDVFIDD